MIDDVFITPSDISARLKVSRSRGYQIARQCGKIKFGQTVRISEKAFQRWLEEHALPAERGTAPGAAPREPLIKPTRWPDGFDPHPPRKPKAVIGRRRRAAANLQGEAPIRPRKPRS